MPRTFVARVVPDAILKVAPTATCTTDSLTKATLPDASLSDSTVVTVAAVMSSCLGVLKTVALNH